jgi:hypothetical protein
MELKLYLTASEAAPILGLSLRTMRRKLRHMRDERELPRGVWRDGPFWRIEYDSLGYIAWRTGLPHKTRLEAHDWANQVWGLVQDARRELAIEIGKVAE